MTDNVTLLGLPVTRLTLVLRVESGEPLHLPDFAGSMLRGAFGKALRELSCMTRQPSCDGCPLLDTCPYPMIFEAPPKSAVSEQKFTVMPNPYVIEPPAYGERKITVGQTLEFSMVVIGKAIAQLPLLLLAWDRALQTGLGKTRSRCQLESVRESATDTLLYHLGTHHCQGFTASPVQCSPIEDFASMNFLTPLRLVQRGKLVGTRELDAYTLLTGLWRRLQFMLAQHAPEVSLPPPEHIAGAARAIRVDSALEWRDWQRYSARQQQSMQLGGLLGRVDLEGDLAPFAEVLTLGQWLHLGKSATFGLGRYCLDTGEY